MHISTLRVYYSSLFIVCQLASFLFTASTLFLIASLRHDSTILLLSQVLTTSSTALICSGLEMVSSACGNATPRTSSISDIDWISLGENLLNFHDGLADADRKKRNSIVAKIIMKFTIQLCTAFIIEHRQFCNL